MRDIGQTVPWTLARGPACGCPRRPRAGGSVPSAASGCESRASSRLRALPLTFFFFQAEDGIRDYKVTEVQTCALPISPPRHPAPRHLGKSDWWNVGRETFPSFQLSDVPPDQLFYQRIPRPARLTASSQIGRASCRERV